MKKEISYKEVERMLYNYNTTKAEIVDISLDIDALKNDYMGINGASSNEKPTTPTNAFNSTVENEIISRDSNISRLQSMKHLKEIEVRRIDNMLTTLRDDEKEVVELKYFKKTRVKMIAYKLNLSEEAIRKNNSLIISSLTRFLNKKKLG